MQNSFKFILCRIMGILPQKADLSVKIDYLTESLGAPIRDMPTVQDLRDIIGINLQKVLFSKGSNQDKDSVLGDSSAA